MPVAHGQIPWWTRVAGLLLVGVYTYACGAASGARAGPSEAVVALVDVTVIPMDTERVLPHQTVIIRDGLIAELGPTDSVQIPRGAQRVEGAGRYALPGLVDAHVHLRDPSDLLSYLAHGVTSVVHLSGPAGNVADTVALREQVARGEAIGPSIYTSGRILDGDPPIFAGVSTVVRTPDEVRQAVEAQLAAGVDLIKVYNNLPSHTLRAAVGVAHDRGLAVWGHVPRAEGRSTALQQALDAGLDVIAHGEEVFFTMLHDNVENQLDRGQPPTVPDELIVRAARLIRTHDAAVIPNLSFVAMTRRQLDRLDEVWAHPEATFLHPTVLDTWRRQNPTTRQDVERFDLRERGKQTVLRTLTRALHDSGVPLLLGTDSSAPGMFPGASAIVELEELVRAGLTPFEALSAGTRTAGRILERQAPRGAPFGTLAAGSRADLMLLEANPLTDVSNAARIAGVVAQGRWHTRDQLDALRTR